MNERLASLLIDLSAMTEEEADHFVFEEYVRMYLDQGEEPRRIGVRHTHDDQEVLFTESRYDHAFRVSRESTSRRYCKEKFDRSRGKHVAWIGPIVAGQIVGTACWFIPQKNKRRDIRTRPANRFYLVRKERYIVWLESSLKRVGWWFSSAYIAGYGDVRRYCRSGIQIWAHEKSRD